MFVSSPKSPASRVSTHSPLEARHESAAFPHREALFYSAYPPLAGQLPHYNPRNGANLLALKITCDDCSSVLPLEAIRGLINDYSHCIEVRYAGVCPHCRQPAHNVLRMAGDELRFIQNGKWCVTVRRPWWHCLWPWPIDREWS